MRPLLLISLYALGLGTALAADLQGQEPANDNDPPDWSVFAQTSASATNGFTVAGIADGVEYQGFYAWVELRPVEEPDR